MFSWGEQPVQIRAEKQTMNVQLKRSRIEKHFHKWKWLSARMKKSDPEICV